MPTITRGNAASFRRPLSRPEPALPVQAMKTYSVVAPLDTHWRSASCEEVGCLAHHNGWQTKLNEATDAGVRQLAFLRRRYGLIYKTLREDGLTVLIFPPGTPCPTGLFGGHKTRRSRPPLFVVRRGDYRGYGQAQVHSSPEAWVDDFASHQDRLAKARR